MSKSRLGLSIGLSLVSLVILTTLIVSAANTIEWQLSTTGLSAGLHHSVAFGDLNHDGQSDLVAVGTSGIAVYAGDGAGHWAAGLNTGLSAGGLDDVALGDFNNDGALDIVASGSSNTGVRTWRGNGLGSWTVLTTGLPITGSYAGVALGDVNRDGRLDVIVAGSGGNALGVKVYLNTGSAFSATTALTTTGSYGRIAAGPVDGDGYLDVVAANSLGGVSMWRGGFNNTWTLASVGLTTTGGYRGVALGDVNNDGKPDLVTSRTGFANQSAGGLFVFNWSDALNSWSLAPNQIPVTGSYDQLTLADLNNDGWLDLIAGGWPMQGTTGAYTFLGSPMGFSASTALTTTVGASAVASADFDHDGLPDVAAGDVNGAGLLAWRDAGVRASLGTWQLSASPQITGSPRTLAVGDMNRDGQLDVITARPAGGLNAWLGNGGNGWSLCPNFSLPGSGADHGSYESVLIGPFSRLAQDVIGARVDGGGIQHYAQSGGSTCSYFINYSITSTGSYRGLSAGDIDRDGYWEVVAAPISTNLGLRLWKFNASWLPQGNPVSTGTFYATALGDFNHSGKSQIVAASADGSGVSVFELSSVAGWLRHFVTLDGEYHALAVGDLNHDGNLDVVAGKGGAAGSQGIYVWLGDGALSSWTPITSPTTSGQYTDLDLADFNHDGELDILAARNGEGVMVWAGDGAGNWTPNNTNLPVAGIYGAARFAHVDHDGNLDVVATDPTGAVQVWTAAEATPPTISAIQPSGWISTTQSPTVFANVIDTGSGLNVASAQYRYSIDGGASWSGYLSATVSGANGVKTTQILTATSVPFNHNSGTQNKIEFSLADVAGNIGRGQGVIKIDTVPPTAPISLTSTSHITAHWSSDNTILLNWGGATDATSGVYAYAVLFDHSTSTLPTAAINAYGTSYLSAALADSKTWYAHVRTVDAAGNWSATAIHLGPFYIDTTPPANPTSIVGAVHTPGVWSSLNTIGVGWAGASDGTGSGISGYAFVWDTSATTIPPTTTLDNVTFMISAPLPDSNHLYFHVRTRDAVGNWNAGAAHLGPFYIDTTPPTTSMSSPATANNVPFAFNWSGSDAGSGIASYYVQIRDATAGGSWQTGNYPAGQTSNTVVNATPGHFYEFRALARDNVGNVGTYPATYQTRTAYKPIDLSLKSPAIEVNQAVQDLNNSVLLVAKKRTFVRCYVQGDGGTYNTVPARLRVYRGTTLMGVLSPSNTGAAITIKPGLSRANLNDSFYFDVPTQWLSAGFVTFECDVNSTHKYAESDYSNNLGQTLVGFYNSPKMQLYVVDVPWDYYGTTEHIRDVDYNNLVSWLKRAYPISQLSVQWHYFTTPYDELPDASDVNSDLYWIKIKNVLDKDEDFYLRYYGMAYDGNVSGGFMRGESPVPGVVASGPTGTPGGYSSWDTDQSYGDWYGGHELGHSYDRSHVAGAPFVADGKCGGEAGTDDDYPYPNGDISPTQNQSSANAMFGFDPVGPTIYGPEWKDVMTYCQKQWISNYTYTGIWARMLDETPVTPMLLRAKGAATAEHIYIAGKVVTPTDVITLSTFYRVPNSVDLPGRVITGTYHIKLYGAGHSLLADYNFSPAFGSDAGQSIGQINEFVPWITGTQEVAIWHNNTALVTRTVSANAPIVMLTSPNGGETLSGDQAMVTWQASDSDSNPLTYSLDYSRDGGATWDALTGSITKTQITIDAAHLGGTTQGKFRVWASDGVNTTLDETDGTFTVTSKAPRILSITPVSGTNYIVSQTVTLDGSAIDVEDGTLADANLQWTSSLQGPIGTGEMLQTTDLITGTHIITLAATDSDHHSVTATTIISINPDEIVSATVYLPIIWR